MRASEMQNRELNLQIGDVRGRDSVVDPLHDLRGDSGEEIVNFGLPGGETALVVGTLGFLGTLVWGESSKMAHPSLWAKSGEEESQISHNTSL